jgi:hypothetical protein
LQPGRLTEDVIAGRRARWLSPLRVYLICSLAFFISGPFVERVTGRAAREVAKLTISDGDSTLSASDAQNRAAAIAYLRQYMDSTRAEAALENIGELNNQFLANVPKAMFLLMPLFALVTWAAWRAGGLKYPAHLHFSLHVHASFFAAMTIAELAKLSATNLLPIIAGVAALVYTTWYGVVAAHRVLGGTAGQVAVRGLIAAVVYGAAFTAVMFGLLAYSLATL